jgi:uncharacterized protein YkwD
MAVRLVCVAGILVLTVLSATAITPQPTTAPMVAGGQTSAVLSLPYRAPAAAISRDLEVAALYLLNQERASAGLPGLLPHAGIRAAARMHGKELFTLGYLTHRSRDGRWPTQRVKELGVKVTLVGENLAYAGTLRDAHQALVASAVHRSNMLSPRYRRTGIAVIDGGRLGVIVVQDFSD